MGPQVRGIRTRCTGAPGLHQLLRRIGEQARRQAQRPYRRQLVDFAQQRLQPDLARVDLQLGQQTAPTGCGLLAGQRLQAVGLLLAQPGTGQLAEPFLERRPRRTDDAVDPAWGFDPLSPAAHQ
jgi:hypothetical protein